MGENDLSNVDFMILKISDFINSDSPIHIVPVFFIKLIHRRPLL